MRGWVVWYKAATGANVNEAIDDFERALRIDPEQPEALVGLSRALASKVINLSSANPVEDANRADALASKALSVHPENAAAHLAKAFNFCWYLGRYQREYNWTVGYRRRRNRCRDRRRPQSSRGLRQCRSMEAVCRARRGGFHRDRNRAASQPARPDPVLLGISDLRAARVSRAVGSGDRMVPKVAGHTTLYLDVPHHLRRLRLDRPRRGRSCGGRRIAEAEARVHRANMGENQKVG